MPKRTRPEETKLAPQLFGSTLEQLSAGRCGTSALHPALPSLSVWLRGSSFILLQWSLRTLRDINVIDTGAPSSFALMPVILLSCLLPKVKRLSCARQL